MDTIRYREGDHYPNEFQVKDDDGVAVDLTSASTVTMEITLDDATTPTVLLSCTTVTAIDGTIRVDIPSTMVGGMYRVKWMVIDTTGTLISYPTSEVQWLRVMSKYGV